MSERYGPCRYCNGTGERSVVIAQNEVARVLLSKTKDRMRESVTMEIVTGFCECGSCGGTGHSGDAMLDYKG